MKNPQPIYDAAVRFAPVVLAGVMEYAEVNDILSRIINRHFIDEFDEISRIADEALCNRISELECAAADTVRQWIAPLIAARAPKAVLIGAARGATLINAFPGTFGPLPYLTDEQVKSIVLHAVRAAMSTSGGRRAG